MRKTCLLVLPLALMLAGCGSDEKKLMRCTGAPRHRMPEATTVRPNCRLTAYAIFIRKLRGEKGRHQAYAAG